MTGAIHRECGKDELVEEWDEWGECDEWWYDESGFLFRTMTAEEDDESIHREGGKSELVEEWDEWGECEEWWYDVSGFLCRTMTAEDDEESVDIGKGVFRDACFIVILYWLYSLTECIFCYRSLGKKGMNENWSCSL